MLKGQLFPDDIALDISMSVIYTINRDPKSNHHDPDI